MRSIGQQLKLIVGLLDTKDVNDWEDDFIRSVWEQSNDGKNTSKLSEKQVNIIERIHNKHFA